MRRIGAFKQLVLNIWRRFRGKYCLNRAAELGFWSFYSIFPFITFIVALSSFLPFARDPQRLLSEVDRILPFQVEGVVGPIVKNILGQRNYWMIAASLLLALWAASRVVFGVTVDLNDIYEVQETRPFWKRAANNLLLVTILALIYILAFLFVATGPIMTWYIIGYVGLAKALWIALKVLRPLVAEIALFLAFTVLYKLAPNFPARRSRAVPGALFASIGWIVVSSGFELYITHIRNFDRLYGALGAVVLMLTWLYLIGLMILLGGIVNFEIMRREGREDNY